MTASLLTTFRAVYIADIVFMIYILISAVVGLRKGFIRCFFRLISTAVAIFAAMCLAETVAGWLDSLFGLHASMTSGMHSALLKIDGFDATVSGAVTEENLAATSLPSVLRFFILKKIGVTDVPEGSTLASAIAPSVASFAERLIASAVVFIAVKLLMLIVRKLLERAVEYGGFGAANRFFGMIFSMIRGIVKVSVILFLVGLLPFDGVGKFMDQTVVLGFFYRHNIIVGMIKILF